jgi:hypothetical protein
MGASNATAATQLHIDIIQAHLQMVANNTTSAEVRTVDPSVWGDFFINYVPQPMQARMQLDIH